MHFISATRLNEHDFWKTSSLGKSILRWRDTPSVQFHIHYENKDGLPKLYNQHIRSTPAADLLIFLHDDVYLNDPDFLTQIRKALARYDVVGVAGNVRLLPRQPAWCFKEVKNNGVVWDSGYLSGAIAHGIISSYTVSKYGPVPMACQALDGVFLAARCINLKRSRVTFDENFKFHFYDIDFCRTAIKTGLTLGTWSLSLIHESSGSFGSSSWNDAYKLYLQKWDSV
ncbi:hypothetical protein RS694_19445 [Rhodoferax saidenbachensis]|uniref:Streptomycin biosynthesis protein StrF domain-containing protein n=1 Tax=Rhodoferax saidenbachensis TaxID=1484693 RepID=A0A1P8KG19_9BURK|nr:hypothetical protein RS694_19445 [Rhodoferax saidenbachensis]